MPIGLGVPELIIVLLLVVMLFGLGRLPEVGRALGQGIREFRASVMDNRGGESQDKQIGSSHNVNGEEARDLLGGSR